jgi:flagella basal body P-ring formation protein FlgA
MCRWKSDRDAPSIKRTITGTLLALAGLAMNEEIEPESEPVPQPRRRPRQSSGVSSKTLLLMVVALACGLAAAYLTSQMANQSPRGRESKLSGLLVPVVVAKKEIPAGTAIADPTEFFRVAYYRGGDEPQKAVKGLEELKGKVIVRALAEDQPVKEQDVSAK